MTQDFNNLQIAEQTIESAPALKQLNGLVGDWNMKISNMSDPAAVVLGQANFEWLPGEHFMVENWDVYSRDFPTGTAIMGWSSITENFTMHYYDSRGIARIYEMSLMDGVWKIWRAAPGFSQRFKGIFSEDGNTILGTWEKSVNDAHWEYDFDVMYTKVEMGDMARTLLQEREEKLSLSE